MVPVQFIFWPFCGKNIFSVFPDISSPVLAPFFLCSSLRSVPRSASDERRKNGVKTGLIRSNTFSI